MDLAVWLEELVIIFKDLGGLVVNKVDLGCLDEALCMEYLVEEMDASGLRDSHKYFSTPTTIIKYDPVPLSFVLSKIF